ncbi:Rha family transcriptional regulator [Roseixanthobacter liquoris]|uniref:hypothetical protein n=1 Tax=Roseixanthobacter liquoris TaxID=3119921 RepID=UPI00372AC76D
MNDHSLPRPVLEIQLRDGEPRVFDLDLANRLGFGRARNIRPLIERHIAALDQLGPRCAVQRVVNGGEASEFYLTRKQAIFITAKSETAEATEITIEIIERFDEYERGVRPTAIPTTAEALAHTFRMLADQERAQAAHTKAIAHLEEKVERVETAQTVLKARPSNAEAITHIRVRIGRLHGLSGQVIDAVMRQTTYAPKPAGMVKNDHESADGATYAVYWQKDVTETFKRFVSECVQVTPTMFTHPSIEGRFRCAGKGGAA